MKAKELVERFKNAAICYEWANNGYEVDEDATLVNAKQCALICVDEIMKHIPSYEEYDNLIRNWQKVKQAIEKL